MPDNESDIEDKEMPESNFVIECRDDQDCVCAECWMNVEWTDTEQIEEMLKELGL